MQKQEEKIAKELKSLIDSNGKNYLNDEPFEVYKRLKKTNEISAKMVGAVLCVLVRGLHKSASKEDFSNILQQECGFNKKTADSLMMVFRLLFSKENCGEWKSRENEGMKQFLKDEFVCEWKGTSVWHESNGYVSCFYNATIKLQPQNEVVADKKIKQMLKKNPFMTTKVIHEYFADNLCRYLDHDFEYYCTCEDYYQPVVEDYELDYKVTEWCRENGFILLSCEGEGGDWGYEPNFWRNA